MLKLAGIFASLPTPFDWNGNVYPVKVHHNVARLNRAVGLAGYVLCGRIGEANELTRDDKQQVMKLAKEAAAEGRILIAGIGSESLRNSIALSKSAAELGYQSVLADPMGRDASLAYYRAVADQSVLPVIIAGADPETAAAASHHPNVAAIVTTGPIAELAKQVRSGVQVFASSAGTLAADLQSGAAGAVLSYAAAVPYPTITIWEAVRQREAAAAEDWQARIAKSAALTESNVAALKHAMDLNGYYGGAPRLPLSPVLPVLKAEIEAALDGLIQRS